MRNAGLDESQAAIKIAGRNFNNLIYADDTALMAESEEELRASWWKVKEESEKAGLKLNITKLWSWHLVLSLHGKQMGKTQKVSDFIFLGFKITVDDDYSHEIKRHMLLGRIVMTNLDSVLKSKDITLWTKVHMVKYGFLVFPVVMYVWIWELDHKEGWEPKN